MILKFWSSVFLLQDHPSVLPKGTIMLASVRKGKLGFRCKKGVRLYGIAIGINASIGDTVTSSGPMLNLLQLFESLYSCISKCLEGASMEEVVFTLIKSPFCRGK